MATTARARVAIIGGGPAGLIAAHELAPYAEVHLYEQGKRVGRKFLVAGEGGLNITNRMEGEELVAQVVPGDRMRPYLLDLGPNELRGWLRELGVDTFVGSSGRVFPDRSLTPAMVLRAIEQAVLRRGAHIHTHHTFTGFTPDARPVLEHAGVHTPCDADAVLFALGGASWPVTGSTGGWSEAFRSIGVRVNDFHPSNCGIELHMTEALRVHAGKPLKNIRVSSGPRSVRGEVTITAYGLEGNAIYPVVPAVRDALLRGEKASITLDLKPDLASEVLSRRLSGAAASERTAALRLDRPALALLKAFTPHHRFLDDVRLVEDVKALRIPVQGLRPMSEAISSVGGVPWDELSDDLSLRAWPHLFVAGEMIDWDAPTGGFLLQGCFSLGHAAAAGILRSWRNRLG